MTQEKAGTGCRLQAPAPSKSTRPSRSPAQVRPRCGNASGEIWRGEAGGPSPGAVVVRADNEAGTAGGFFCASEKRAVT